MKIGIDIGGSHIAVGVIGENGNIINKIEQDIKVEDNINKYIVRFVDETIQRLSQNETIDKIGIAVPGSYEGYKAKNLVNLGIKEIDFSHLAKKYNTNLSIVNDAKAAGIAEKKYGSLKNYKYCIFLCLGTGIGGAAFLDEKLLKTYRSPGLEIGHMVIDKNGEKCECGKNGCFETFCSIKRFKDKIKKVIEDIYRDDKSFQKEIMEDSIIFKEVLYSNLENKKIKKLIQEYIDNMQVGLYNIIDIFEPEAICLGGGFTHYKDILYYPLLEQMEERKYFYHMDFIPEITLAKFENDAGMIGAVIN